MPTIVETFEQIVRYQSLAALVDFLVALNKADLLPVRQRTKQLYRAMNGWRNEDQMQPFPSEREKYLLLAGLATYSKQEALVRTFDLPWNFELANAKHEERHRDLFSAVVRHSRPSWLTAWFERIARNNSWRATPYHLLRELADEDLISPGPWLLAQSVAHWLKHYQPNQRSPARQSEPYDRVRQSHARKHDEHVLRQLRADPVLLNRDLPLLFDFDTTVEWAGTLRGEGRKEITWLTLLPQLAESGHLDRADLLTRCLLALRRDFRRPLLKWFKELFLALKPTADERLARQAELIELLAHPLAQVVNFALDQLKDLWPLPGFEIEKALLYANDLLTRPDLKTGLKTLFVGFDKLLKANAGSAPTIARLSTVALAHADAGVQERAAKTLARLLGTKKPLLDAAIAVDTVADLQELGELLSTPARTLLAPWLAATPGPSVAQETYVPRAGFVPDISVATAIAPVADWHELLFLTGQALQRNKPAEQERWLDGLLRLRNQYPDEYAAQLHPYLLQALPYQLEDKTKTEITDILRTLRYQHRADQHEMLRALFVGWYGGFTQPQVMRMGLESVYEVYPDPLLGLARQRLLAAEARLAPGAAPLPLLSTPTHQPFWVAPTALVAKLLAYEAAGQTPDPADLVLALGRLAWNAPADAAVARQQLAGLHHVGLRELLAWLLASGEVAPPLPPLMPSDKLQPKATDQFSQWVAAGAPAPPVLAQALPWLWAVAARTRAPQATWPELAALVDYPGLAEPWEPEWSMQTRTQIFKQSWNKQQPERVEHYSELIVSTADALAPPSPLLLYSLHARLPQKDHTYTWSLFEDASFLLSLLPNNPAPLHWHVLRTAFRTNSGLSDENLLISNQLHPLLTDGPVYDVSALVVLAVGLLFDKPTSRALAWEVLLAAVGTGRLVPAVLGNALGRLLAGTYAPVSRLADALPAARGISPAIDDVLRQLLEALLPELPAEPLRNTAKLLAAYADLRPGAGQPLPAAVRERLQEWQTVGSLKKAALTILNA